LTNSSQISAVLRDIVFLSKLVPGRFRDEAHYRAYQRVIEPLAAAGDGDALNYLGERELRCALYDLEVHFPGFIQRALSRPEPFDIRGLHCRDLRFTYENKY